MKRFAIAIVGLGACGPERFDQDDGDSSTSNTSASDASASDASAGDDAPDPTIATTASSTDTTSGAETTGLVDSGDASSGSYILDPDGGYEGPCFVQCDTWAQDCPEDSKCVPSSCPTEGETFNATMCRPVAARPASVGSACVVEDNHWSGHDDCEFGSVCWYVDGSLQGTCVAQCTGNEANWQCPADHSCESGFDGGVTLCLPLCDPLASTCADRQMCLHGETPSDPPFGHFVCQTTAPVYDIGDYGAPCDDAGNACAEALACVSADQVPGCAGASCCTMLGQLATPPACPDATQTCIAAYADGEAPAGLEDLCFCGVAE